MSIKCISQKEEDYFSQEPIEVISSGQNGNRISDLLANLNGLLTASRKHLISKDYENYFKFTRQAFYAAHDLNNNLIKSYAELFMTFIKDSLSETRLELKFMSSGFWAKKKYRQHLQQASLLLEEFENYRMASSRLDSWEISWSNSA